MPANSQGGCSACAECDTAGQLFSQNLDSDASSIMGGREAVTNDSTGGGEQPLDLNQALLNASVAACRKQMLAFAKTMRDLFLKSGVASGIINDAIRQAFEEYKELKELGPEQFAAVSKALYLYGQPHGLITDPLGMILTEHALRRGKPRLLHPHNSPREKVALESFAKGAIPWPVVRYLLIGLRGSMEYRDPFDSSPLFFGPLNERLLTLRREAEALVARHTVRFSDGRVAVDWATLYETQPCHALAAELTTFVLEGLEILGASRLQNLLENLRNRDLQAQNPRALKRSVTEEDAAQLIDGLRAARKRLAAGDAANAAPRKARHQAERRSAE